MNQSAPYGPEVRIRIGGPAGLGIKAAGQSLARVFTRAGFHCFDLTEYPSLIKGGHNTYHLRVSEREIHSHVMATDVLIALDAHTIQAHLAEMTQGGAVIYDPDDSSPTDGLMNSRQDICWVAVPFMRIVRDAGGMKIMRNTAALGAALGHMGVPLDGLSASIRSQFAHKPAEVSEQNVSVATAGYEHAQAVSCGFPYPLVMPTDPIERILVDGNEAVGLGALSAGIGLYCAYPMTPASSLLHFLAKHGEHDGVVVKHTEDELAAMNMVIGGAFGGTRSMCASAGGGFSLMVEAYGFAGVSESACVVGLFTRPGPATGMPTWTEQSDLRFALHASQGEFCRVVLAPGDHTEAFELTWKAFNLADRLQTPVIILGDSYLSDNRRTCLPFDVSAVSIDRGDLVISGTVSDHPAALNADGRYQRYMPSESGVSTRIVPGVEGAIQLVNSYEHDSAGYGAQGEDTAVRVEQNTKRLRKEELARALVPPPNHYGEEEAEFSIMCFGTVKMPVLEAMAWLEKEDITVNVLQVVTVAPFPAAETLAFAQKARRLIVIEGNATGQLEGLVREYCLVAPTERLRRSDGRPISPEMIYAFLKGLNGTPVALTEAGALARTEGA